jgi:hypothetical protein
MPGRRPLFSKVTGRCLDARSSHYISAARSSHGTTSDRPIPQSSSAKKVVRHCEFSETFGILEKHHAWFLSNLKWSLVVNSRLRVVGHPFLGVGGLKEAPRALVREHVTRTLQHGRCNGEK